jgi:hypothetical protein
MQLHVARRTARLDGLVEAFRQQSYDSTSFSDPQFGHCTKTPYSCPSLTPSANGSEQLPHRRRSGPSPLKASFPFGGAWMIALDLGVSSTTFSV